MAPDWESGGVLHLPHRNRDVTSSSPIAPPAYLSGSLAAVGKLRVERHAAIDIQRRAGNIIGLVRGQPDGGARNILGLADAAVCINGNNAR